MIKQKTAPVIILEEGERVPIMKEYVSSLGSHALVLPTIAASPTLDKRMTGDIDLVRALNEIGTKEVFIGGQLSKANKKGKIELGCVGFEYKDFLKHHLAATLMPKVLYPDKPSFKTKFEEAWYNAVLKHKLRKHQPQKILPKGQKRHSRNFF